MPLSISGDAAERKQQVVAELRRSEILAAAAKVFAGKGFDATRMEEIAAAAGLAKGTLYRYFASKDEVYEATVQQALDKLAVLTEERVRQTPEFRGKLAAFVAVRMAFWHQHQQLYRIIVGINGQENHRRRSYRWQRETVLYLAAMFEAAAQGGEIPVQDYLAAAWATMDAIRGVNERRVLSQTVSVEEQARFLTGFLLRALGADSPAR